METVKRQDVVTLQPTKWLNDNIVNFVGKAMIQPWRGSGTAKVHLFSSHLMDKILGGGGEGTQQSSTTSRRWKGGVTGYQEVSAALTKSSYQ